MMRLLNIGRIVLAAAVALAAGRVIAHAHAARAAWESTNHCVVVGYSDPGVYQTNPRRTLLGCDCGFFWR